MMELNQYLRIVLRRWPIALIALVITCAATALYVAEQPSVYKATGTYVIRPTTADVGQGLRAMETLNRGVEINSTYAAIARSRRIKDRAEAALGQPTGGGLTVSSEVVTGSNILEISVSGAEPQAVHDLAVAVGAETVAYVAELQELFLLAPLDSPRVPTTPVAPNRPLLLVTGFVFGLALGVLLAIVADGVLRRVIGARSGATRVPVVPVTTARKPTPEEAPQLRESDAV
jgi:capsular polysaccharide biosynthesis protein